MELCIEDELDGASRKMLLELLPLHYALTKFDGNKTKAAKWLGISNRGIRNKVREFPQLAKFRCEVVPCFEEYRKKKKERDRIERERWENEQY